MSKKRANPAYRPLQPDKVSSSLEFVVVAQRLLCANKTIFALRAKMVEPIGIEPMT